MFYRKDQDKIAEYFLTLFKNYNRKVSEFFSNIIFSPNL